MSTIHFVGGEKGGVGKSVVARLLAQYMIDRAVPFTGFDTDRTHGALLRFYGAFASAAAVREYEGLDAILETAVASPDKNILVDLAAQTHEPLADWIDNSGVLDLAAEAGITLRYWNVLDSGKDSAELLEKLLDHYGARLNYVLVQNQVRGEAFPALNASKVVDRALDLGASVITIKRLHPPTMLKIDTHSLSFWAARTRDSGNEDSLGLLDRQRVKVWMAHAYSQFEMAKA